MNTEFFSLFFKGKRAYVTLFLCGLLSAIGFAPYYCWVVTVLSTAILCRFLISETSCLHKTLAGFWFGFGQGAASMYWLVNALMIDSGRFVLFTPFVPIGMGILFGLFFAIPAFMSTYAKTDGKKIILFSAGFVFFEWVRSWFLTGFPWNLMGSVFASQEALLQTASVMGVYGLSLIAVLTAGSIALLPRMLPIAVMIGLIACLELGGAIRLWSADQTQVWGVKLRLVQPNIPQSLKWNPEKSEEHLSRLIHLSKENNKSITHVIWPESAVDFPINANHAERIRLMSALRQGGTLILGGMKLKHLNPTVLANSIFVLNDLGDVIASYDKSHLVPFGEYVPLADFLPIRKIVPIGADFSAGKGVQTIPVQKAPPAGMLVCYEVIFSGQVVDSHNRPDWLINVTNDAWYGQSMGPHQHFAMARLRAVEEGLPVARAANNGISAVIDPYGRADKRLELGQTGVLDSALPAALNPTVYARTGPLLPIAFCMLLMFFSLKKQNNT